MRYFRQTYRDRKGKARESRKIYCEFKDHLERVRRLALFSDQRASEAAGARIETLVSLKIAGAEPDAELTRWLAGIDDSLRQRLAAFGLLDAGRMESARPLTEHLADWKAALLAKGTGEEQATQAQRRAWRVLVDGCGFQHFPEIKAGGVRDQLKALRQDETKDVDGEVQIIRRGISAQTSNHHLTACKGFCGWMVRENRATSNPLTILAPLTEKAVRQDQRHERRVESPQTVARLLETTAGEPERFGMTGPARALLYRLAVETGLRRGELASLTRLSFRLDAATPHVAIHDGATKNGKAADVPLLPETAALLGEHLADMLPMSKAFRMPPRWQNGDMLQADLAAAGIPYRDAAGRYFDFHSFRHATATYLAERGVHPKTVQDIMRHANIETTLRYFKATVIGKRAEALAKMPDLSASAQPAALEATNGEALTATESDSENAQQTAQTGKAKSVKTDEKSNLEESTPAFLNWRSQVRVLPGTPS